MNQRAETSMGTRSRRLSTSRKLTVAGALVKRNEARGLKKYYGIPNSESLFFSNKKIKYSSHSFSRQHLNPEDKEISINGISDYKIFAKYLNYDSMIPMEDNIFSGKLFSFNKKNVVNSLAFNNRFCKQINRHAFTGYTGKRYKGNSGSTQRSNSISNKGKWNRKLNKLLFNCRDLMNCQHNIKK